jgi:hypothetical protein
MHAELKVDGVTFFCLRATPTRVTLACIPACIMGVRRGPGVRERSGSLT